MLFYIPKEVTSTGEVLFDTELVRMNVNAGNGEKVFKKAVKLLDGECPDKNKDCSWCMNVEG